MCEWLQRACPNIKDYLADGSVRYILEVDLLFAEKLHNEHNRNLLTSERMVVVEVAAWSSRRELYGEY